MSTETEEALKRLEFQAQQQPRSHASMLQEARDTERKLRALDLATELWVSTDVFGFNLGYVKRWDGWRLMVGQQYWSNPLTGIPKRKLLLAADRMECARALPKLPKLIEALTAEISSAFKSGGTP